jgi:hypothetical protein
MGSPQLANFRSAVRLRASFGANLSFDLRQCGFAVNV